MFKDNDYVPKLWDYDNTHQAVVLSQKELKALRDELNKEYLRRWSGYVKGEQQNSKYMDYTGRSTQFTDSDGKHIHRLPSWNGRLAEPTDSTPDDPQYRMADGNVDNSYWDRYTSKDYRGSPAWYGPMDRYVDGSITYSRTSNNPPTATSQYQGPAESQTFPVGTPEWRDSNQYRPHGVTDVTKDRSFKHLIDGLVNIVDVDKYFGSGIVKGDPVVPVNPVNYGQGQDPYNSERINHTYRQTGFVTNTNTPGQPATTSKQGTIKDWISILKQERRNSYYIRACNYQHWIWYFTDISWDSKWFYEESGEMDGEDPSDGSFEEPTIYGRRVNIRYESGRVRHGKTRNNYNPAYYGHREAYTSCLTACTGFCSQTCFHVCDEQCVYLCDDSCGYSCMSNGRYFACGSVCIANCTEFCGGQMLEGGSGGDSCSAACDSSSGSTPGDCGEECAGGCEIYAMDEQACDTCIGFCSDGCDTICINECRFTCTCSGGCTISCADSCNESGFESEKQGCSDSTCNAGCDDECLRTCLGMEHDFGGGGFGDFDF